MGVTDALWTSASLHGRMSGVGKALREFGNFIGCVGGTGGFGGRSVSGRRHGVPPDIGRSGGH